MLKDIEITNNSATPEGNVRQTYHNTLERRRRDNIKRAYSELQATLPYRQNENMSRLQILKEAIIYIKHLKQRIAKKEFELQELRKEISALEQEVRISEKKVAAVQSNGFPNKKRCLRVEYCGKSWYGDDDLLFEPKEEDVDIEDAVIFVHSEKDTR